MGKDSEVSEADTQQTWEKMLHHQLSAKATKATWDTLHPRQDGHQRADSADKNALQPSLTCCQ